MQLELTESERRELTQLLQAAHADLGSEIHHAREMSYRDNLRQRRILLEGLIKRLGVEVPQAA